MTVESEILIKRIVAREEEAMDQLYQLYGGLVYSLALRILRDPGAAEGVVQQTFVTVWRKANTFDSQKAAVATWITAIARNRSIDMLRRSQRKPATVVVEQLDQVAGETGTPDPLDRAISSEQRGMLLKALNLIPGEQREAIFLNYYGGLSHRQISDQLKQPLGTVKTRIQLGLNKLRSELGAVLKK